LITHWLNVVHVSHFIVPAVWTPNTQQVTVKKKN
jgi:hypothetical protein